MHPVLIHLKTPSSWMEIFGPQSFLFGSWKILLPVFLITFFAWAWFSNPNQEKAWRGWIWVTGLTTMVLGLILLSIIFAKIGKIQIRTYGVMLSVGFLVGIILAAREGMRHDVPPERVLDLSFWIIVSAIVGSRVLYIIVTWHQYAKDPGKLFRIWEGGLVFYGGLIGAVLMSIWFMRHHKLNFWKIADIFIPSVPLGQAFGRLGCFSAGCCYGKEATDLPWAVTFTKGLAPLHTAMHPTQLYESSGSIFIFILLLIVRSKKRFHGHVLATYLLLYACLRFTVELFRGDKIRGFLFEYDVTTLLPGPDILSSSQVVSLALLVLGLTIFALRYKSGTLQPIPPTEESPCDSPSTHGA